MLRGGLIGLAARTHKIRISQSFFAKLIHESLRKFIKSYVEFSCTSNLWKLNMPPVYSSV